MGDGSENVKINSLRKENRNTEVAEMKRNNS